MTRRELFGLFATAPLATVYAGPCCEVFRDEIEVEPLPCPEDYPSLGLRKGDLIAMYELGLLRYRVRGCVVSESVLRTHRREQHGATL